MRCAALLAFLISFVPASAVSARTPLAVSGQVGSRAASSRLELEGKTDAEPVASVSTGADGAFTLEAPETGMWKVVVEARELVPKELLLIPLVDATELPPVKLERDAKLEVRVAGPDGSPTSGVRIRIGEEPQTHHYPAVLKKLCMARRGDGHLVMSRQCFALTRRDKWPTFSVATIPSTAKAWAARITSQSRA